MAKSKIVLGIDPGLSGALVVFGAGKFEAIKMPVINKNEVDPVAVQNFIIDHSLYLDHIFLERVLAFKMGRTSALNYGVHHFRPFCRFYV
jgi:aconitase A